MSEGSAKKYYIYHIQGLKVGVTTKIKHRRYMYRRDKGKNYELEVLEVMENVTEEEVGDREWWWADQFGYPRGTHYRHTKASWHGSKA